MSVEKDADYSERILIRTKLRRPPVAPDILRRARLLALLQEGSGRTLTLISAPAGYGKSTLASLWASTFNRPQAWVTLDNRDTDFRSFLGYVLAAIRQAFPNARLVTEALMEAAQLPPTEVVTRQLLNDLDGLPEPFVLVLDDYHNIRVGAPNEVVGELLTYPPESLHLVIVTRRDPALPLARLRARGLMTEIRAVDLRFTADEAMEFLKHKLRLPIDRETVALLEAKTEGWVTGLRLAGLFLRDREDPAWWAAQLSGSTVNIAEYLVTEVLTRQSPEFEGALAAMSVVDRFCAPLCQAIHSGDTAPGQASKPFDAQSFIDWLVETNVFVVSLDDRGYWYRYHHLFQDFLQNLLRQKTSAEAIQQLHGHAGAWLAKNGLIEEAIRHFLTAGDNEAAIQLFAQHRHELMNSEQFHQLRRWLELVPKELIVQTPVLLSTQAFLALLGAIGEKLPEKTEQIRRILDEVAEETDEYRQLEGEVATLESVVEIMQGRAENAFNAAQKALQRLPKDALLAWTMANATLAGSLQMAGELAEGIGMATKMLADPLLPENLKARMWAYLCIVNFMEGDSAGVLRSGRECLRITGPDRFPNTRSHAQYYMGVIHYLRNELEEAESCLGGILDDRALANAVHVIDAAGISAFIRLSRGCQEEAEEMIESVLKKGWESAGPGGRTIRDALRIELMLRRNDLDRARRLSQGIDFDLRPIFWLAYVPQLTSIKLLLVEGSQEHLYTAQRRLIELNEQLSRIYRNVFRVDVLALLSITSLKLSDESGALKFLRDALKLASRGGLVRNFVDLGPPMVPLLELLVANQPDDGFAAHVRSACAAETCRSLDGSKDGVSSRSAAPVPSHSLLTDREAEILRLLGQGLSNQEVADKLFISLHTVKTHLQNVYGKLDARGRVRALTKARGLGLIPR